MSLKELREELRALRKESVKPVSRMKKGDILMELERVKSKRETTPPVASTDAIKPKKMEAKIDDIKRAKEKEFPTKPAEAEKKKTGKKVTVVGGEGAVGVSTKMSKKAMLQKMLDEMSDSDE